MYGAVTTTFDYTRWRAHDRIVRWKAAKPGLDRRVHRDHPVPETQNS